MTYWDGPCVAAGVVDSFRMRKVEWLASRVTFVLECSTLCKSSGNCVFSAPFSFPFPWTWPWLWLLLVDVDVDVPLQRRTAA